MKHPASVKTVLFFIFLFLSGSGIVRAQVPVASFTVSAGQACAPATIQFSNTSQNGSSYYWTFGNGNSSTLANPANVYATPGSFTVTLTVTSGSGQSATTSSQVNIVAPPVAQFSSSTLVVCEDYGITTFQNTSTGYDSCVWDFGDGTTSTSANPSHAYAVSGTFTVKLVVYNKNLGCSNMLVRNNYITVNPRPVSVITVDTFQVCDLNHVFTFNATVSGSATSWLWKFGDGTTSASLSPVTHQYSVAGNYTPQLILENSFGCSDTSFLADTLKVKSNPVPQVTVTSNIGCEPLAISFICNNTSPATYLWNFGNGSTATTRNGSVSYAAGTYIPTFSINYANGCSQYLVLDTIRSLVSPATTFTMTNQSGCAPLSVTFTNNTPGNNTYLWYFGDGDSSISVNPVHVYDSAGFFVPSLTAISQDGCTRTYRSGWYYVNASGPTLNFHPDITSGCAPLTVNFNNLSTGATTYHWDFGDGDTSSVQHPTHIYQSNGIYTVTLIAENAMGCTDTLIYPVNINVSSLTVNSVPAAPVVVCAPYTVYFSDNTAASAWLWDFGDGTTSPLSNPRHTFTLPGTYQVDLTVWLANGGCSYTIQNFQTFIVEGTRPGFTYSVSTCPPYAVTFTDTTNGASSWQWSFGDGGVSSVQNPVHVFPNPGSYTINLTTTNANGCVSNYSAAGGVSFAGLGANPAMVTTDTVAPYLVQFYSNSTFATSWLWDFGDGNTSNQQNPTHSYATTGPFTVSLTISNDSCSFTYSNPPVTVGTANANGGGFGNPVGNVYHKVIRCAPYSVNFYTPFPPNFPVEWIFGDGTSTNQENPVHVYTDSGAFTPMLVWTDSLGVNDTIVFTDTFFVAKAPSDFQISTQNSCNGIIVNVSAPGPGLSNTWYFDNGVTATGPSASHIYPNVSGNNVIRLNSVDTNGCKAYVAKSFAIDVNNPLSVSSRRTCADDTLTFLAGNMNFASYLWDFGDGQTSTLRDPLHAFADSGLYQVTLLVTDINGCTMSYPMNNTIEVFKPVASFTILQPSGNCTWVYTKATNNSTGADTYLWNFGDGQISTAANPFNYYTTPGIYDITLTAYRNVCVSTMTLPAAVTVPELIPGFSYVSSGNCLPSTFQFTDTSQDATHWYWDFGDGDTSSAANPAHIFTRPPTGAVTLTVTDINGCVKTVTDTVIRPTDAAFTASADGGCAPLNVVFTDSSFNAVSYHWDFGDGDSSSLHSPVHDFQQDGFYPVTLTVTGPDGCISSETDTITVITAVAAFNADSLNGCAPLMVQFANESSGATDFHWDFGDGSVSGLKHPQHLYSNPGIYTVTLVATNIYGCADTLVIPDYIVTRGSLPDFTLTPLAGCAPLNIQFTDLSAGAVSWQWFFGDGNTFSGQNVSHVYADSGSFTPTLYTTDSTGCTSVFTYPQPVIVKAVPEAVASDFDFSGCYPVTVNYNASATIADSIIWDMGDGTFLNTAIVNHTYAAPGTYLVKLIAYNNGGCTDTLEMTPVKVYDFPVVSFNVSSPAGCYPFAVNFVNTTNSLHPAAYSWDFGNGNTDTSANPVYTYPDPGIYDVTLIAATGGGCADTLSIPAMITVYDHQPPAEVNWQGVTVNSATEAELNFFKSTEPDLDYYIIYRLNSQNGLYDSIAVITQASVTQNAVSYKDINATPSAGPCTYKAVAVDICGYRLLTDSVNAQTTVFTTSVSGFMNVAVNWTAYGGKTPSGYAIYRTSGNGYSRIATVSNQTFDYNDTTAYCPSEYTYRIIAEALDNSAYNSLSNTTSATPASNIADQEVDILRTTVVDNDYTLTEWKSPALYPWLVERYYIYRSVDNVDFNLIADVPAQALQYEDHTADVHHHEYYYRITAVSECGSSGYSGPGSSVWLQTRENNLHYFLQWTPYKEWDSGVEKYRVEKLNANGFWEELKTVNGVTLQVEAP